MKLAATTLDSTDIEHVHHPRSSFAKKLRLLAWGNANLEGYDVTAIFKYWKGCQKKENK